MYYNYISFHLYYRYTVIPVMMFNHLQDNTSAVHSSV